MDNDLSWEILGSATWKFGFTQKKQVSHPNTQIHPRERKNLESYRAKREKNKEGRYAESSINAAIN